MKQESLIIKQRSRYKYNSYKGKITSAVENIINRNFHADKPNRKVYLSPIIDCLDGIPVKWTVETSPNAELANTMLKEAIATLALNEKPIVHSNRGCHYRWPEWIRIMTEAGVTRSMSKKGCSADTSACEGFFGHLKTKMILSILVDTFFTRISVSKLQYPKIHNISAA